MSVPDTMQAALLKGHDGLDKLELVENYPVPVVAGAMFNDLINLLQPEGRYTTAGAFAGPVVELDLRTVYLKHLQIHGSSQGSRGAFKDLLGYINDGRLSANLDATYQLSDIHRAQQEFMQKKYVGKLVVIPDRFYSGLNISG